MNVGMIGLGRMGRALAYRLTRAGYAVVGFDVAESALRAAQDDGITVAENLESLSKNVHVAWIMVPAGKAVDAVIEHVCRSGAPGLTIIDGGNSNWQDTLERARTIAARGMSFIDCGISGGLHGRDNGFCIMVGGDKNIYKTLLPLFSAVAAPEGIVYTGPSGAGHYVKMVHNGIEYGLLQAYAEGLNILHEGSFAGNLADLAEITRAWQHGSIIRSWILDLAHTILVEHPDVDSLAGSIGENGTGRWAAEEAQDHRVNAPVLQAALQVRMHSRILGCTNYATKLVALLRREFGGHELEHKR